MQNKSKLLVVDDTPANLEFITEALSSAGYQVTIAISGDRALNRLKTYTPDLILLDVQMPGIDGFETCRQIKENPNLADIPIIFITALSDPESIARGFSLGAVDYINKPFQEAELFARVKNHIQTKQFAERLTQQVEERTKSLETAMAKLKSSQIQIIQQEKMSALGNLVAGVAHEINNPIGFVRGNVKELQRNLKDIFDHLEICCQEHASDERKEHAEDIDLAFLLEDMPKMLESMAIGCDRIRDISVSLRTFSREDRDTQAAFDLHEGIDSTLLILKHRLKASDTKPEIEVIKDYRELPLVYCFPGQLNQVLMNILANAIDALEEKNTCQSLSEINAAPNQITIQTDTLEDQVYIRIRDNGMGMPETVRQHIFDHLYTTKDVGKGTGLGLAIARQIVVEKHGGKITVESAPGQGTEFTIALPVAGIVSS